MSLGRLRSVRDLRDSNHAVRKVTISGIDDHVHDRERTRTESSSRSRSLARIGPGSSGRSMTREEFDALRPGQFIGRNRYELINGVLVVSPRPGIGERNPND